MLGLPHGPVQHSQNIRGTTCSLRRLNTLTDQLHSVLEREGTGCAMLGSSISTRPSNPWTTLTSLQSRLSGKRGCTDVPNMAMLMSVWDGSDFTAKTMAS